MYIYISIYCRLLSASSVQGAFRRAIGRAASGNGATLDDGVAPEACLGGAAAGFQGAAAAGGGLGGAAAGFQRAAAAGGGLLTEAFKHC